MHTLSRSPRWYHEAFTRRRSEHCAVLLYFPQCYRCVQMELSSMQCRYLIDRMVLAGMCLCRRGKGGKGKAKRVRGEKGGENCVVQVWLSNKTFRCRRRWLLSWSVSGAVAFLVLSFFFCLLLLLHSSSLFRLHIRSFQK